MDLSPVPGAGEVRREDAFDVPAVASWLRKQDLEAALAAELEGDPEVRQFSGGASNLTYLLRFPGRDLILRRPPAGQKARGAHDMRREFTIQSRLRPVYPYVPRMVAFCDDESVVGSDFYVMERVEGTILGRDLPPGLDLSEQQVAPTVHQRPRPARRAALGGRREGRASVTSAGDRGTSDARSSAGPSGSAGPGPTTSGTSRTSWPGSTRTGPTTSHRA